MIQSDAPIRRMTIRTHKARAGTLLVLSAPVAMCRKLTGFYSKRPSRISRYLATAVVTSVGVPRRPQIASAGFQLVRKFREQLNLGNTECAGGRIVRRAQCDHRPHKAPIGIV
jgi:hypothetical protein